MRNLNKFHQMYSPPLRYALAVVIFFVALFLRFLIAPAESGFPFVIFYPAMVVSFYLCGIGPGTLLVALSAVTSHYMFISPYWEITAIKEGDFSEVAFLISAYLISLVVRQLQKYAKQSQVLFESSPTGMVVIDPITSRFIQANDYALKMFGYNGDEFLTKTVADITYPEDLSDMRQRYEDLSNGQVDKLTYEKRYLRKDGSYFWAEVYVSAVKNSGGKPGLFIGNAIDITKRKQSEIALKAESEKNLALLHNASDGIHILDIDGNVIEASNSFCSMLGYQRNEMIGMNVSQWESNFVSAEFTQAVKQIIAQGARSQVERRHRRKDGTVIDVEVSNFPLDLGGKKVLFCSSRDITERNVLEKNERESKNLLNNIIENIPDMIFLKGVKDLRFELFNRAGEMLLGRSREQLLGRNDYDFFPKEQAEWFINKDRATLEQENVVEIPEELIETPQGTRILHTKKITLRDVDGQPLHLLGISEDITERKQIEQDLKIENEKNLAILHNASDGIHILDMEGNIIEVSDSFCTMLGHQRNEMIGMNVSQWDGMFVKSDLPKIIRQQHEQQTRSLFETRHQRKDGTTFDVEISGFPLKLGGRPVMFYSSRDITEHKKAEDATKAAARYSRSLLEASLDPLVTINIDGKITDVNVATERATGIDRNKLIGTDFINYFTNPEKAREGYQQVFLQGFVTDFPLAIRHLSGKVTDVLYNASLYSDENGKVLGVFAAARDITERKKAESELRIAATAFETQEGMFVTDANSVILRVNHAFTEITGYTAKEIVGQSPRLLKSDRHDESFYASMWECIRNTGAWQGEIWNRRKNGEVFPEQLTITAVKGDTQEVTHYVATLHDITLRKAAEEQIRTLAFYDSLTQLPNRRLLNDRLGQAMAASKRSGRYGALMFLDLDNFKPLNDTHGHGVGDLLLIEAARRINSCVREVDTVARLGGDEFVVMLSELEVDIDESTTQAGIVAEKIRSTLAEPYHLTIQQEGKAEFTVEHHCTSSVGVVMFINHAASSEDLLKYADQAMYQAKADGRNLIRFFDPQGSSDFHPVEQKAITLRLTWDESYDCGESTIDQEHRKLFELANNLIDSAFTRNDNPQAFESALEKLLAHVLQHFANEEAILARNHYAELADHALAHMVLIDHAVRLRDAAAKGGVTVGELVNFLADEVVAQHMLKIDRKFYPLFQNSSRAQSP